VNLAYYEVPQNEFFAGIEDFFEPSVAEAKEAKGTGKIAIYHTHSDEAYVPTDGKESIAGAGTIYKVGGAFKAALEKNGLQATLSDTKHDPHDNMAYERSRRTALSLIKSDKPDAVFDVHRDAVPPEVYGGKIDGQDITKIQLVVGKHGPTAKQAEEYALQIKAASDKKHPGLVKGIFFAKGGDYNQDLHPRAMLLEVGAHTNSREAAEKGIAMFADVMPLVLGKGGKAAASPADTNKKETAAGAGTTSTPAETGPYKVGGVSSVSGAVKAIGIILALVVLGSAVFLYLSTGSLSEARSKLRQFVTTEFANFLGPKKKK
jgi:stage II sporulation protein P